MSYEKRRKYENDVFYEVWRSGRNPDRIDMERVDENYWNGVEPDDAARSEIIAQRRAEESHDEWS